MTNIYLMRGNNGEETAKKDGITAIVVDALRASATLLTLLESGAKEVIITSTLDDSYKVHKDYKDSLLVGERDNLPPDGFSFGNSPLDILANSKDIEGKTVIFTTSNGAKRLINTKNENNDVFVGTIANKNIIARYVAKTSGDIIIISSGEYGNEDYISLEDDLASCLISEQIIKTNSNFKISKNSDINYQAVLEKLKLNTIDELFLSSPHGKKLRAQNLGKDIYYCASDIQKCVLPKVTNFIKLNDKIIGVIVENRY